MFLLIVTIAKALLIITGLIISIWQLKNGLSGKDEKGKQKALVTFLVTGGLIFVITVVEFLIAAYA